MSLGHHVAPFRVTQGIGPDRGAPSIFSRGGGGQKIFPWIVASRVQKINFT